jgi:hypothetical protein
MLPIPTNMFYTVEQIHLATVYGDINITSVDSLDASLDDVMGYLEYNKVMDLVPRAIIQDSNACDSKLVKFFVDIISGKNPAINFKALDKITQMKIMGIRFQLIRNVPTNPILIEAI